LWQITLFKLGVIAANSQNHAGKCILVEANENVTQICFPAKEV
jgi:hypothetical protein